MFMISSIGETTLLMSTINHHILTLLRVDESPTKEPYLGHNVIGMYYKTVHLCFCFGAGAGQRTALIASSKTVLSPLVVNAEHSKYLTAPTSLAIERPCK
jgi:hypothetical protein